ncbi:hypothetical protein [Rheinheimera aquimaris]|jgi:hypothetical protein|uniref:hypothetical protein n=1 Tax=Rheinheimera aquimaris TaxID=412437 RepID=UPI0010668573|nr:hypothetical protein [Rheinheimera aquimaris]|tara:strand:+ start:4869 stop:5849 length:981 start_codon:yes stop_codon:yes gene_type:complete
MYPEGYELNWIHHGLVFQPPKKLWWTQSHAQCPVIDPTQLACGRYRIYFSSRDKQGKSRIGSALLCPDSFNVQLEKQSPSLELGITGRFDDAGVMPACVIPVLGSSKLLYIGWMERKSVPYQNAIGLATINREDGELKRDYPGPVLTAWANEAYFTGTIHVIPAAGQFQAYYLSCVEWSNHNGRIEPRYDLKIARSTDLVNWQRMSKPALELETESEGGYASAAILKLSKGYLMFYCMRGAKDYREDPIQSYKIYTATSKDALNWTKTNQPLFNMPPEFANQMQCYPQFLILKDRLVLFYNGNDFGRSGFGCSSINLNDLEQLWKT